MYINDLSQQVQLQSQIGMFADDVALWTTPTNANIDNMKHQHQQLQISLNKIANWCTKWKLILSEKKTQYIVFKSPNKKKYPQNLSIELNKKKIEPIEQIKYLGLYLDSSLSFKYHIYKYLLPKLNRKLGWLKMITGYRGYRPHILVYQTLYKMILRPSIEYACAFWNGAKTTHKRIFNTIQRKALNNGLKLMNNVSYDSTCVINNIEPIKYRIEQEEIKLLKRCKIYLRNYPNHTLSKVYRYWENNLPESEYGPWNYRLSVLTRAQLNANLYHVPIPLEEQLEQQPRLPQMPRLIELPNPTNTPYNGWIDKHYDDVLSTFIKGENRIVIFTDGSCDNNPGYGGSGIVIFKPGEENPINLEYPINGLTTNIAAEIIAIDKTIEWINNNIKTKEERIIIFSDCKPVIDCILNRNKSKHYGFHIRNIQRKINKLINIPELYWIKSHIGIKGNELADKAAKNAKNTALNNMDLIEGVKVCDEAGYLTNLHIEKKLIEQWNKYWINENRTHEHSHCKSILPTIEFGESLFHQILIKLEFNELKVITRLISGHVQLNHYMTSIGIRNYEYCPYCSHNNNENDQEYELETIEHYLLYCSKFEQERIELQQNIIKTIGYSQELTVQFLLTGYPCKSWLKRRNIVNHTLKFIKQTNRMNI